MNMALNTDSDALTMALYLALTAPDDRVAEIVDMAEDIASRLTEFDVAACKRAALAMYQSESA